MNLHEFLDCHYGADGAESLRQRLQDGDDVNARDESGDTPLHMAARRCRADAVAVLLDHGADIEARTKGGKTAFVMALRRSFDDVAKVLRDRGADPTLNDADRLADALSHLRLDEARRILAEHPEVARTGNPEEDRLLSDVAGRNQSEPVAMLIQAGADLTAPGLDDGTPLHVAAWFGQPHNARLLIEAGAPLDIFERVHHSSPIGWATHGSRYSGGVNQRQDEYVEVTCLLLEAGSSLHYPDDPGGDAYWNRMLEDASDPVRALLEAHPR